LCDLNGLSALHQWSASRFIKDRIRNTIAVFVNLPTYNLVEGPYCFSVQGILSAWRGRQHVPSKRQ